MAKKKAAATPAQKRKKARKHLVIVESPAKARTINKYLGGNYVVKASMGHVRDLPKGKFGIDLEEGFRPEYTTIRGKGKVVAELKRLAKSAETVYLAPDMDREGEAIAWHLAEILDVPEEKIYRVVFNEITKSAILAAFENPGRLDMDKVNAQQARRVLDRIMGYKLSPLLWRKIAKGLSAGRVQSVAVRLIVEREQEIRAFVSEEYWRVTAELELGGEEFHAELKKLGQKRIDQNLDERTAKGLIQAIGKDELELVELEEKPKTRRPTPPLTTSQLQQKASTQLRFSAKKTMTIAQQLYEGIEVTGEGSVGLVTYTRTDSVRVSTEALDQVRVLIGQRFGDEYLPDKPNAYVTKAKAAQEAHEAIRPTDASRTPEMLLDALTTDQHRLYRLIWEKFVASQMKPARFQVTTATLQHPLDGFTPEDEDFAGPARFIAQGEVQLFDGHLRVFSTEAPAQPDPKARDADPKAQGASAKAQAQVLPTGLETGKSYGPKEIRPTRHETKPPPRYSEATLVKELEKKAIGRPSTYATIISTIQDRGYVDLERRQFHATELGEIVTEQLVNHFGDLINTDFTSHMESDLDKIESGDMRWSDVVAEFHKPFMKDLERAEVEMKSLKTNPKLSDIACDKCGAPMAELYNKRGKFLGCSKYPECKNTLPVDGVRRVSEVVETDYECPKCGSPMVIRAGKRGRFLACTAFPKCRSTASVDDDGKIVEPKETGIVCEKCGSPMVVRGSRRGPFLACSGYPKCRNAKPLPEELREEPREAGENCEKCGSPMVIKHSRWGKEFIACSAYPQCKNTKEVVEEPTGEDPEALVS
ncbi:MAG: type I DNA topoisomerase [Planctomycetota bacterium]|nr:type I DNA topoisomerase [Planctomycetota bacterium]